MHLTDKDTLAMTQMLHFVANAFRQWVRRTYCGANRSQIQKDVIVNAQAITLVSKSDGGSSTSDLNTL